MASLESLVREGSLKQGPVGLINGDAVLSSVRSDGEFEGLVFFLTRQGDVYYAGDDGVVYHALYDDRRRSMVREERARIDHWVYDEARAKSAFSFDAQAVREAIDEIAWRMERRRFLRDESSWLSRQLLDLRGEAGVVDAGDLREALLSYVPSRGSVAPFGRETQAQGLFIDTEEGYVPLDDRKARIILQTRDILRNRRIAGTELHAEAVAKAEQILGQVKVGRVVRFENGKESLASFLLAHGLNNGGEEYRGIYEQNMREQYFWVHSGADAVRIDLLKGLEGFSYEREDADVQGLLAGPSLRERLRDRYAAAKLKAKERLGRLKGGLRKAVVGALVTGVVAGGVGGFYAGKAVYDREPAPEPAAKVVVLEERRVPQESLYVVRPGDNVWDVAKGYVDDKSDRSVLEKTNEVLVRNGKLTISEYESKKSSGEAVEKGKNPHLIFPGDELVVPLPDKVEVVAVEKGDVQDSSGGARQEGKERRQEATPIVSYANEQRSAERESYVAAQAARPVDYVGVLRDAVRMRNAGASLQDICAAYNGFRDVGDVERAFADYQGYVQSGMLPGAERIGDAGLASSSLLQRMAHEYRSSGKSLAQLGRELSAEYGVAVSAGDISREARRSLGVKSRKQAKASAGRRAARAKK